MTALQIERWADRYARFALGAAFLSAVGSRLGLWGHNSWGAFVAYTGEVNAFMPAAVIPFLAVVATACELSLGVGLILGVRPRFVAAGAAVLLAVFGSAMAISFGPKSPLDYSVFSASACAVLLALRSAPKPARS